VPSRRLQAEVKVFLDAEYTSLAAPDLLSIGMVAEDGREFYGELSAAGRKVNAFVRARVIPQLGLIPVQCASPEELGRRAGDWLLALDGRPIDLVFDYPMDFTLPEAVLRSEGRYGLLEDVVAPVLVEPLPLQPGSDEAMYLSWTLSQRTDGIARHHALADARALRAGYEACHAPLGGADEKAATSQAMAAADI
jgi:hypothetical protein